MRCHVSRYAHIGAGAGGQVVCVAGGSQLVLNKLLQLRLRRGGGRGIQSHDIRSIGDPRGACATPSYQSLQHWAHQMGCEPSIRP